MLPALMVPVLVTPAVPVALMPPLEMVPSVGEPGPPSEELVLAEIAALPPAPEGVWLVPAWSDPHPMSAAMARLVGTQPSVSDIRKLQ